MGVAMTVLIDPEVCAGRGLWAANGPDVFSLDDLGYAEQPDGELPEHLIDQAERGAAACPERAISLTD